MKENYKMHQWNIMYRLCLVPVSKKLRKYSWDRKIWIWTRYFILKNLLLIIHFFKESLSYDNTYWHIFGWNNRMSVIGFRIIQWGRRGKEKRLGYGIEEIVSQMLIFLEAKWWARGRSLYYFFLLLYMFEIFTILNE